MTLKELVEKLGVEDPGYEIEQQQEQVGQSLVMYRITKVNLRAPSEEMLGKLSELTGITWNFEEKKNAKFGDISIFYQQNFDAWFLTLIEKTTDLDPSDFMRPL